MRYLSSALTTLCLSAPFAVCSVAQAQSVARLTAVQQTVEVRSETNTWRKVKPGVEIKAGDAVRTGKRSKVDIKFADGSVIRLGQLSTLQINSPRDVRLENGTLLISYLKPGRVVAGSAAAEIKGTVATVEATGGLSKFTLYEGALDVVSAAGTVPVPAGREVIARADGTLSGLRNAASLYYGANGAPRELLESPQSSPFVGSSVDTYQKATSSAIAARESGDNSGKGKGRGRGNGNNGNGNGNGGKDDDPLDDGDNGNNGNGNGNSGNGGDDSSGESLRLGSNARIAEAVTRALTASAPAPSLPFGASVPAGATTGNRVLLAQIPAPAPIGGATSDANRDAVQAAQVTNDLAENNYLSPRALERLKRLKSGKGRESGFDARAIGVVGDAGTRAYGARIHGYYAQGNWLLDGAYQPLRVRAGGQRFDLDAISDLSLTYRNQRNEVQLGRQRFLAGPVQATLYGSLVRQGGREVMDAIRYAPQLSGGLRLEVAYLIDAYPRNLPYRVSGRQQGFYARYAFQKRANFGLNLIGYDNLGTASSVGASLDFALPLVRDKVDFYGELGRDTYQRRLTTLGVNFPELYDRTGYDLYLEIANLGSSSFASRPPTEVALRAYRKVNDNLDVVGSVSRFSDGDTLATLGISAGTRIGQ